MSYLNRWAEFSSGSSAVSPDTYDMVSLVNRGPQHWSIKFRIFKGLTDYGTAILVAPFVLVVGVMLLVLNPIFNKGPVLFWQRRMGRYGQPFWMVKFRTMTCNGTNVRESHENVELHRITRLGKVLRKMRIDELPNFHNVLRGEMSLVGPRPDAYSHAETFSEVIAGYKERHRVKPGITGLAQVEMGYAEGKDSTQIKSKYDNIYATRSCGRLDVYIILKTVRVVLTGFGGK
jgi:lipopolysaccharide/colanic/teichoic acid biosynthesis glycosyltransferase